MSDNKSSSTKVPSPQISPFFSTFVINISNLLCKKEIDKGTRDSLVEPFQRRRNPMRFAINENIKSHRLNTSLSNTQFSESCPSSSKCLSRKTDLLCHMLLISNLRDIYPVFPYSFDSNNALILELQEHCQ